jgi:hypothetical protein
MFPINIVRLPNVAAFENNVFLIMKEDTMESAILIVDEDADEWGQTLRVVEDLSRGTLGGLTAKDPVDAISQLQSVGGIVGGN